MRALESVLVLGSLLLAGGLRAQTPARDLPRGQVVPRVACAGDPAHSYALYLPSTYTPERRWPVVFGFDPAGNGERAVRFLQDAAETYGYIVLGSNDSRNGPPEPILAAQAALWREARTRFAVEPAQVYGVGFSGGARAALRMALDHPGAFAGVICCGAYLPMDRGLPRSPGFALFCIAGTEDFNLLEFRKVEKDLARGSSARWFELFVGGHRWPDPLLGREALEFMRTVAMRRGQIPSDGAFLAGLVEGRNRDMAVLKASGALLPALWKARQTGELFRGLPGADAAAAEAAALAADPQVVARLELERRLEAGLERLSLCETLPEYEREMSSIQKLGLGSEWASARSAWALAVFARRLDGPASQAYRSGDFRTCSALYQLAFRADPKDFLAAYNAGCSLARLGQKKEALGWLRKAVDAGLSDASLLERDPDLKTLRADPEFQSILALPGLRR
jgi:tetratricopeptide (TPR) repeat protein